MPADTSLKAILSGPFSFTARPEPVAGDLRMSWGIAVLILALLHCRGKKSSFQKLQFLAHAVRLPEGREDVRSMLKGTLHPADISVRVEPWLNRAVAYAHGLKLVSVDRGKSVALTEAGIRAANVIAQDKELLAEEWKFFSEVAPKLTEAQLVKIWRMEDLL